VTRPVHIVVVAYHGADDLDRALSAVGVSQPVTVVDNSQSDTVRDVCERRGAAYVRTTRNLGFAAGVNIALRQILAGEPCDVLLLNPDAVLPADAIPTLVAALGSDERACAVAPTLLKPPSAKPQRSLWPFPSPRQAWLEAVGLARMDRSPSFAAGTVLLVRWEALQEVGLFDERFFLYAEETDWQRRAHDRGWHSLLCEEVAATHVGGATSADASRRQQLFYAAQERYVRKWYGSSGWLLYRLAVIAGAAVRAVFLPRPRRADAARRLVIYLRGPCRVAANAS
jgi:GT2 family glycosyltransferase